MNTTQYLIASWLFVLITHCTSPQPTETPSSIAPSFTDSISVRYAQGFSIDYAPPYPVLLVHSLADTNRYLLLPRGVDPPELPSAQVIRVPVQRLVVTSTTHLGLVELLDARDQLVGIGRASHVYDSVVRRRAQRGQIQEVGTEGALNVELILSLQPDLVLVSAMPGAGQASYQPLLQAEIPVIANAEWQEASPLGKAEWVKLLAVLLGQEARANQRFATVARAYDSIARRAQQVDTRPSVITGAPFRGSWYVPGRHSYVGQLLRDAQATWPWEQDTSAVSLPVSLETVYPFGQQADYWINSGQHQRLDALREQDERLMSFSTVQQGNVYNYFRRTNEAGGSDYYESGTVRPDLVLADLVEIFHPTVLDHSLYYYQKLE